MKRAPAFPPLFRELAPGRNSYMAGGEMAQLIARSSRTWHVGGELRSMQHIGGGYVKRLDDFAPHADTPEHFAEFIREASSFGSFMPSSYASIFHDTFKSPRVRWTVNAMLRPYFRGAWNHARSLGNVPGSFHSYDLNSAYLWASTLGLPVVSSYRVTHRLSEVHPGIYVVTLRENNPLHPYPFAHARTVLITGDEIEALNPDIERIHYGITYSDCLPADACTRIAQDFSFWKHIGRGYWGRWASAEKVTCGITASGKEWELGNPILNYIWAALIVSRVRMRLWEVSPNAVHFFTDSVITRDELPTGTGLGQWRHVADFPQGLEIRHAGFYRELGADVWLKHAGQSPSSVS